MGFFAQVAFFVLRVRAAQTRYFRFGLLGAIFCNKNNCPLKEENVQEEAKRIPYINVKIKPN